MLDGAVPPAVMVAGGGAQVVGVSVAAVAGQHVVEVEHEDVVVRVAVKPVVGQPVVEGTGVGGVGRVLHRGGCDRDKQLVGPGLEVLQDVDIDALGVGYRVVARVTVLAPQRVAVDGRHRVVGVALEIGVRVAGLEHYHLVLATGVVGQPGVVAVLAALVIESGRIGGAAGPAEPRPPLADVGVVADAVRPPTVVGVAHEVVVCLQCRAKPTIIIIQPVLPAGVVYKDQLGRAGGRVGVVRAVDHTRGIRAGGAGHRDNEGGQRKYEGHAKHLPGHGSSCHIRFSGLCCCIGTNPGPVKRSANNISFRASWHVPRATRSACWAFKHGERSLVG